MLALFGSETQHQRQQETVLGMEFLLTYMIVLTYLQAEIINMENYVTDNT